MSLDSFITYLTVTDPPIVQIMTCIGHKYLHFVLLKLLSSWITHVLGSRSDVAPLSTLQCNELFYLQ